MKLAIECNECSHVNNQKANPVKGYSGDITKVIKCQKCNNNIVIKYKIEGKSAVITEKVSAETIYEKKPEKIFSIIPKQKK